MPASVEETSLPSGDLECALPPARVNLMFDSKKISMEAHLLLGIDLWWLKARSENECLSRSEFRKNYRGSWKHPSVKKGRLQLERGEMEIDVEYTPSTAREPRKRVTILSVNKKKRVLVFECEAREADGLIRALKSRAVRWKNLVCGSVLVDDPKQGDVAELLEAFQSALQLDSAQATSSGATEKTHKALEGGSVLLATVIRINNFVGELHKPLKEVTDALSDLKEPMRILSFMPFVGGGLGLVADALDLSAAIAKNKNDRKEANEKMCTVAKRLLRAFHCLLRSKGNYTGNLLLDVSRALTKLERELRKLEQYDLQSSLTQAGYEFLKRGGPTRVLDSIKEIGAELTGIQVDDIHEKASDIGEKISDVCEKTSDIQKKTFDIQEKTSDIQEKASDMHEKISDFHNSETCTRSLCRYPLCEKINKLNLGKEFKIPNLPAHTQLNFENAYRPEKILKDNLLSKQSSGTVAALGIRGLGGVGKTTCLIGVASCLEVKNEFKDGIFWIQLSMHTTSDNIRSVLHNILAYAYYHWGWRAFESDLSAEALLNPKVPLEVVVESTEAALKDKKCLLVLDDFWQFQNYENIVELFVKMLTPSSRTLLSTRFSDVAKQFNADTITVKDLDDETASSLFDKWCEWKPESEKEEKLKKEILKQCSNLALAVCIAGSNVRRIAKSSNIKHGLERVLGDLKGNLANLQRLVHMREDQTLNAVIQTSIDSIADEGHKNAYQCLAVFNNKTRVPEQALKALWMTDAANVEARVDLYVACSLATRKVIDESGCTNSFYVEFHDQHLVYAKYSCRVADERLRAGERGECWKRETLASLHAQLVDGYKELRNDGNGRIWWAGEHLNDGYFHENYAHHLGESRRIKDLVMLLTDYRWIAIRCRRQEMKGLLEDFDHAISTLRDFQKGKGLNLSFFGGLCDESSESCTAVDRMITSETALNTLGLVRGALRSSQAILWERKDEISFQIVGRLLVHSSENILIKRLTDGARQWEQRPWLCPVTQCLESPMSGALQVLHANSPVSSVAVCHKNRHLVACGTFDGNVRLWDGKSGECKGVLEGHQGEVWSVAVTEDGSVVVSGSDDGTVRLWDGKSRECKGVLEEHQGPVWSVAVTEDGSVVVSGSDDRTVRLWDGKSGECKGVLEGHQDRVRSVAVTEDGSVVVSGSVDGTVRLWDGKSGECTGVLEGHRCWVRSVAVTEDGGVVVSGSDDMTVRLWDGKNGECKGVLEGHQDRVWSVAVTEDGSVVMSGSEDRTIRLWDGKSGECKGVLEGHQVAVRSVAVTEDGSVVVSGSDDRTVRLWDGKSGECKGVLEEHQGEVCSVAVTEDGGVVVSGSDDGTVRLWDGKSGECNGVLEGHQGEVCSVAVTEDGSAVVSGSDDGTVRLWDGKSGECNGVLEGHQVGVRSVAVTEDGSVVVSGSDDMTVRLWDGKSGECKGVLEGHRGRVWSVAVTEDGCVVVSGSHDRTVRLWDGKSGECTGVLEGHRGRVWSVAVTEDRSVVVSGSDDMTVRLWDGKSGECKGVLEGHWCWVRSVAVTEDGIVVVSRTGEGTVRLWDGKSGECLKSATMENIVNVGSRDFLRWARLIGLLTTRSEVDFSDPGTYEMMVESGVVRIVQGTGTVMSATFDNTLLFAFVINSKFSPRVIVLGNQLFVLEITSV